MKFIELRNLDWYDGPLVSVVVEETTGQECLAIVAEMDYKDWWRAFIVVPIPAGETDGRKILTEATIAYLWDYGDKIESYSTPIIVDSFLGEEAGLDLATGIT